MAKQDQEIKDKKNNSNNSIFSKLKGKWKDFSGEDETMQNHPFFKPYSGAAGIKGGSMIFWLIFLILAFFSWYYKNAEYAAAGVIILFLLLMIKPRLLYFLDIQLFGETDKQSKFGKVIKVLLIIFFVWLRNIYAQVLILLIVVVFELFFPVIQRIYLRVEANRQLKGGSGSGIWSKIFLAVLLDAVVIGFTMVPFLIKFHFFARIIGGVILWARLGVFGAIGAIVSVGFGFLAGFYSYMPVFTCAIILSILSGASTRKLSSSENNAIQNFTAGIYKIIIILGVMVLIILAPLSMWAFAEEGTMANLPGFILYKVAEAPELQEAAQQDFAVFWNETKKWWGGWWKDQMVIAQGGDVYTSQVDRYSKGKFGVFINKVEPYERHFYLDDGEPNAILGVDLEAGSLDIEDCDNYLKDDEKPEDALKKVLGELKKPKDLVERAATEIGEELNMNKFGKNFLEFAFNIALDRPASISGVIGGKDSDKKQGDVPGTTTRRLYASYEDCIKDQIIQVSCSVGTKKLRINGEVDPSEYQMYDLEGGGEGFECYIPKTKLNQKKKSEKIDINVNFPFTTKAYIKTYLMDEDKKRDLKRSNEDVLKFYGITNKKPVAVYTSGPVKIEMTTLQNLPLGVKPAGEEKRTRLNIRLENQWDGEIKSIYLLLVAVPVGMGLECTPEVGFPETVGNVNIYEMNTKTLSNLAISDSKTLYCKLIPSLEVLDPHPITTKYIKVITKYKYEMSKSQNIRYSQGDAVQSSLFGCEDLCTDYDGCYCNDDCDFVEVDLDHNCNGKTKDDIENEEVVSVSSRKIDKSLYTGYCKEEDIEDCGDYAKFDCSNDVCDLNCYPSYGGNNEFNSCHSCEDYDIACGSYPNRESCAEDACELSGCIWKDGCQNINDIKTTTPDVVPVTTYTGSEKEFNKEKIIAIAREPGYNDIPIQKLLAIAEVESSLEHFDSSGNVKGSKAGAVGLMQIEPKTGMGDCEMTVSDLENVDNNIRCGIKVLRNKKPLNMFEKRSYDCKAFTGVDSKGNTYSQPSISKEYFGWERAYRGYNGWGCAGYYTSGSKIGDVIYADHTYVEKVRRAEVKYAGIT